MTPASLISEVYRRCGRAQDESSGTLDTDILNALNTVQRNLNSEIDLPETMVFSKTDVTLAASTTNYDLPSDFFRMIQVWENDEYSRELQRITPREYKNFLSDVDTTTGSPAYYDIVGSSSNVQQLYIFPLLSAVTTGSITAFADYSGTVAGTVLATDASHGLATGNTITIAGATDPDYNSTFTITYVSADTFYFTLAWPGATDTGTWTLQEYVPFVYIQRVANLTSGGSASIISTNYPDVLIEGATYIIYRDVIYRDQPEKIAFRKQEYLQQVEYAKMAQRNPDRIRKIAPKRILPSIRTLYSVQDQLR